MTAQESITQTQFWRDKLTTKEEEAARLQARIEELEQSAEMADRHYGVHLRALREIAPLLADSTLKPRHFLQLSQVFVKHGLTHLLPNP